MRRILGRVRVFLLLLVIITAAVAGGCSSKRSAKDAESAANGEQKGYKLPKGADSEYELYKTVVEYLNNGFHREDLSDVYDVALEAVFRVKSTPRSDRNFFEGLSSLDACSLYVKLREIGATMEAPSKSEAKNFDFSEFSKAFSDPLSDKIILNRSEFREFIMSYVFPQEGYAFPVKEEGNPFHTSQTVWTTMSENEYRGRVAELSVISADARETFSKIYSLGFNNFYDGDESYFCGYDYVEIDGKYYLLVFFGGNR